MKPIGRYHRISLLREKEGVGTSIEMQLLDTDRLTSALGRTGIEYTDVSKSGWHRKTKRPAFLQMLADLKAGVIEGVVIANMDRLTRQPRDLEALVDCYADNRKLVFASDQGAMVDITTDDGLYTARGMVNAANKSSADTSRRVTRAHLRMAQAGLPVGTTRPFGWQEDKRTLHPVESAMILAAAKAVINGVGLHTITRTWNENGITSPRGHVWSKTSVRGVLLAPRLAGYRVYQGQIAVDPSGEPIMGVHEPILSVQMWETLKAVITDPTRSGPNVHVGGRKYLLSGLARCAVCSAFLQGNANKRSELNSFNYVCRGHGCGKVSISGPKVDEYVTKLVLKYLSDIETEPAAEPWEHEAEVADLDERIRETMKAFTSKQLKAAVAFGLIADLEAQKAAFGKDHSIWLRTQARMAPTDTVAAWPDMTLEERQGAIQRAIPGVAVRPAASPGARFDVERIQVWQ